MLKDYDSRGGGGESRHEAKKKKSVSATTTTWRKSVSRGVEDVEKEE